jgi:hypothetical protein
MWPSPTLREINEHNGLFWENKMRFVMDESQMRLFEKLPSACSPRTPVPPKSRPRLAHDLSNQTVSSLTTS